MRRATLGIVLWGLVACATTETGTLAIVYGEDDPFTEAPLPKRIELTALTLDSDSGTPTSSVLVQGPYTPDASLNTPQLSSLDIDQLAFTAYDSNDAAIIFGQSLPLQIGGVAGITVDLFVQRKGEFSRTPSPFPFVPLHPIAIVLENRFVLVADGSGTSSQAILYDLLLWGLVQEPDAGMTALTLTCPPLSMAPVPNTSYALLVCATTTTDKSDQLAYLIDLSQQSFPTQISPPTGDVLWSDVAGGATVIAGNGDAFIVGGTRSAKGMLHDPTNAVIKVGGALGPTDASIATTVAVQSFRLTAKRLGAAATWSPGSSGLVVVGGNTSKSDLGLEFVPASDAEADGGQPPSSTTRNFPNDPTQGAGLAPVGNTTVLAVGGTLPDGSIAPVRSFDLTCASNPCSVVEGSGDAGTPEAGASDGGPTDAGGPSGTLPLTFAQGFALAGINPLFIGTEKDGTTHAFLVATSPPFASVEKPFKVMPLKDTFALATPIPSVLVIGGDMPMESFIP